MKPFALPFRKSFVRMLGVAFLACLLSPPAFGADVTIRFVGAEGVRGWMQPATEEWAKKTGNKVQYVGQPVNISATLPLYQLDVFNNAVARPSTVTGADYNQLSTAFSQNVNKVLSTRRSPQFRSLG